jgi:hypothetical protein
MYFKLWALQMKAKNFEQFGVAARLRYWLNKQVLCYKTGILLSSSL